MVHEVLKLDQIHNYSNFGGQTGMHHIKLTQGWFTKHNVKIFGTDLASLSSMFDKFSNCHGEEFQHKSLRK